jgi:putative flavoprotein involved in K+ transport
MVNDDNWRPSEIEAEQALAQWLFGFEAALASRDATALAGLFQADGIWRDVVALSWHLRTTVERTAVAEALIQEAALTKPRGFQIAADLPALPCSSKSR